MTSIHDRHRAHEAKFAQDADLAWKIRSRRNRLLAQWSANLQHLDADATSAYIQDIINIGMPGDTLLMARLEQDLDGRANAAMIAEQARACATEAEEQITNPS